MRGLRHGIGRASSTATGTSIAVTTALLVAAALLAPAAAGASLSDTGRFEVVGVRTDRRIDNLARRFFDNDPRFVGRLVTVAPDRLAFDLDPPCTRPVRREVRRTVAATLRMTGARRNHLRALPPTLADYGLAGAPRGAVATVTYRCAGPETAAGVVPGHAWSGAIGFPLGRSRRALLWTGEALLILRPLAASPAPRPSFACARATTPAERAICADPALARWDRSVAAALAWQRDGSPDGGRTYAPADDPDRLRIGQRRWLAERDRCGADRDCLADRMHQRTDALMRRHY